MNEFRGQTFAFTLAAVVMLTGGAGQAAEDPGMRQQSAVPVVHGLDARIHELHDKLNITDAQQESWGALEQVIHENRENMRKAMGQRGGNAATANALDDMNAYRDVVQTHLENVKRLTAAFANVYNAMSVEQKKLADDIFRSRNRRRDAAGSSVATPSGTLPSATLPSGVSP